MTPDEIDETCLSLGLEKTDDQPPAWTDWHVTVSTGVARSRPVLRIRVDPEPWDAMVIDTDLPAAMLRAAVAIAQAADR